MLLCAAVSVWLVEQVTPVWQILGDILVLFFLAWLIAFFLEPLVNVLERLRLGRGLAVILIYLLLIILAIVAVIVFGPPIIDQLARIPDTIPNVLSQLPTEAQVSAFLGRLGLPASTVSTIYRPDLLVSELQSSAGGLVQTAFGVATSAISIMANLLMLLIISFYMLLDGRRIGWNALRLLPQEQQRAALLFMAHLSASFGGFMRSQIIQALIFGAVVGLAMLAFGLNFAIVTALASAILMLIPLVGPILALVPPLVLAWVQLSSGMVLFAALLVVINVALVNVFMPRVVSSEIGMPPLVVFFAILVGLRLGGALGAFLGIPIMGVIYGIVLLLMRSWKASEDEKRVQRQNGPDT